MLKKNRRAFLILYLGWCYLAGLFLLTAYRDAPGPLAERIAMSDEELRLRQISAKQQRGTILLFGLLVVIVPPLIATYLESSQSFGDCL